MSVFGVPGARWFARACGVGIVAAILSGAAHAAPDEGGDLGLSVGVVGALGEAGAVGAGYQFGLRYRFASIPWLRLGADFVEYGARPGRALSGGAHAHAAFVRTERADLYAVLGARARRFGQNAFTPTRPRPLAAVAGAGIEMDLGRCRPFVEARALLPPPDLRSEHGVRRLLLIPSARADAAPDLRRPAVAAVASSSASGPRIWRSDLQRFLPPGLAG